MSYHNTPSPTPTPTSNPTQNVVNALERVAPAGYHYMPDGTLMLDSDHEEEGGAMEIHSFELDLTSLPAISETRLFSVTGDDGATFSLEIKNEDNHYYNFITRSFQATKTGLNNKVISGGFFQRSIIFPAVTDNDQYDIFLFAQPVTTKHAKYNEVRFGDGSIDINSTTGSNSLLLTKVIYQYTNNTLTLTPFAAQDTVEIRPGVTLVTDTVSIAEGGEAAKQAFSISCDVATDSKCYRIIKQPTHNDVVAFKSLIIGSAPVKIPGENEYPAVTGTGDTDGSVSGTSVTIAEAVADSMAVGDKVTGTGIAAASNVTVVSLDSTNVFTASESLTIDSGITLSFSNRMNYRWPITNQAHVIEPGMKIITNATNLTADTTVADYLDTTTIFAGTEQEEVLVNVSLPAIDTLGLKPVITRGDITTQAGTVIFDKQQKLALAGDTLRIGGYGQKEIKRLYGWEGVFSDLKIELTPVTTTTTGAVSNSTSVPVAERIGILDDVSTVSGIGIDASVVAPTVDTGAGAVTGAGTLVLTAAQTLESGITLAFANAGTRATITGNIEILKAGPYGAELNFDVEKLLSIT